MRTAFDTAPTVADVDLSHGSTPYSNLSNSVILAVSMLNTPTAILIQFFFNRLINHGRIIVAVVLTKKSSPYSKVQTNLFSASDFTDKDLPPL